MATYTEIFNLRDNPHLLNRVATAYAKAATDILNEVGTTPNHTTRATWARKVLLSGNGPIDEAKKNIWVITQNLVIQDQYTANPNDGGTVTDNDIQFVVNGSINFIAGVDN